MHYRPNGPCVQGEVRRRWKIVMVLVPMVVDHGHRQRDHFRLATKRIQKILKL
jgi:hypothetical protein